jgi:26S proteasome regulatory subunit T4
VNGQLSTLLHGVLLYGPPGTGKTLLARALACNLNATFLKVGVPGERADDTTNHVAELQPHAVCCLLLSSHLLPPPPPSLSFHDGHQVVASAIVDKYIGESARVIREMFGYAKEHAPCVIFMDEIDAIGGKRYNEGTSAGAWLPAAPNGACSPLS